MKEDDREISVDTHTVSDAESQDSGSDSEPQVFNFMKEMSCGAENMKLPAALELKASKGDVVVDVGLDQGIEFFAALEHGYTVYGFEANPFTLKNLREKCEKKSNCEFIDPKKVTLPLPVKPNWGYLIGAGAGAEPGEMDMVVSGPGSSVVETAPGADSTKVEKVQIVRISDYVQTDVFFFKLGVQGFEFSVLQGTKELFQNHKVKTLMMEVYPRGLGHANVNMEEMLNFIWYDLGMFCSTTIGGAARQKFPMDHSNSIKGFASFLQSKTGPVWWGAFDDFFCFNRKQWWHQRRRLLGLLDHGPVEGQAR